MFSVETELTFMLIVMSLIAVLMDVNSIHIQSKTYFFNRIL